MSDRSAGDVDEESGWPWWLWVFAGLSGVAAIVFFYELLTMWYPALSNWADDGITGNEAGDAMGPFASLFSALALIAAFITLHMQRKELALQRDELRATRAEMAEQTDLLRRQGSAADAQAQAARAQATTAEAGSFEGFRLRFEAMLSAVVHLDSGPQRAAIGTWVLPDLPLCRQPYVLALALKVQGAAQTCIEVALQAKGHRDLKSLVGEAVVEAQYRLECFHGGVRLWYAASLAGRELSSLERAIVKKLLDEDRSTRMEALLSVDDLLAKRSAFDFETGQSAEHGLTD